MAWVVKLGGSLAGSPHLRDWLTILTRRGAGRVAIVPGGGPFAELVRSTQARWHYSDEAAHVMALHAMAQYAHMLRSLEPALVIASTPADFSAALSSGRVPVWDPVAMVSGAPDIEPSWNVTSDSLAAWLGVALGASDLLLIKSLQMPPGALSLADLTAAGAVDAAFGRWLRIAGSSAWWLNADAQQQFEAYIERGLPPLSPIRPAVSPPDAAAR